GGRLAEKTENTFKNGLVFSNRPVKIQEKIHLRVQRDSTNWEGALRVGFTTVPPSSRSLPLPCLAIPNLTDKPGHWAVPVNESYCQAGSELKFWVSDGGSIYVAVSNRRYKWLTGVDLSQPLWAMIDVYGQTRSILLLGKFNYSYICLTAGFSCSVKAQSCCCHQNITLYPLTFLPFNPQTYVYMKSTCPLRCYVRWCVDLLTIIRTLYKTFLNSWLVFYQNMTVF
uniref:NHR domain-containing protein n=1 Tax=Haplochromis burtoni TaxID=8153 RepID=A0A3Q2VRA0_HAPBU